MIREEWLNKMKDKLRSRFKRVGFPLPDNIRVSCGFPSTKGIAAKSRTRGECWQSNASEDKHFEIFISPLESDPIAVSEVLVHELCHVVTPGAHHRGPFVKAAHAVGLEGKPTSTVAGAALKDDLALLAEKIGPYPHAKLKPGIKFKKQSTRLIKVMCPECGCTIRMTQQWLDEPGPPTCACGAEMMQADEIEQE